MDIKEIVVPIEIIDKNREFLDNIAVRIYKEKLKKKEKFNQIEGK